MRNVFEKSEIKGILLYFKVLLAFKQDHPSL